jgi:hypothetical protein
MCFRKNVSEWFLKRRNNVVLLVTALQHHLGFRPGPFQILPGISTSAPGFSHPRKAKLRMRSISCLATFTFHYSTTLAEEVMATLNVPNWIRTFVNYNKLNFRLLTMQRALLVASAVSFVQQLHRTISRKNSTGISTLNVLFNLISTTEQLALTFFIIVNYSKDSEVFVHNPRNPEDWINLAQMSVVVVLWLI